MEETPVCVVTIVAMHGANARLQMDEKSPISATYANGVVIPGYDVETSSEGIDHVRVSMFGKKAEWIRCWEKDGTHPLVNLRYIQNPTNDLAAAIRELANAILTCFGKK